MLGKIITKITIFALRSKRLSGEQKAEVTSALLDNLVAFPISDIVKIDENGVLKVKGRTLDIDQMIALRESAISLKESFARKLIKDQMKFLAINLGVHQGISTDTITFAKACLWVIQEEDKLVDTLTLKEM